MGSVAGHGFMLKIIAELKTLEHRAADERRVVAITYKDYIKLHPNSKKTPQDPMFSEPQQPKPHQQKSPSMDPPQVISKPYEFDVEVKQGGQTVGVPT